MAGKKPPRKRASTKKDKGQRAEPAKQAVEAADDPGDLLEIPAEVSEITPRQEMFCKFYVMYHNGAAAARAAGYSVGNARRRAWVLIHSPAIQKRIQQLEEETEEYLKIEFQKRLLPSTVARQEAFAVADIRDFMNPDTGEIDLQSIRNAPEHLQLKSIKIKQERRDLPDGGSAESTSISIQIPDQALANAKLGKWVGLEKPDQINIGNTVVILGDVESKF